MDEFNKFVHEHCTEYKVWHQVEAVGQEPHRFYVMQVAPTPELALKRQVANGKHIYVTGCLELGWRTVVLSTWIDGDDASRQRFKMTRKKGEAMMRRWSDVGEYSLMASSAFGEKFPQNTAGDFVSAVLNTFIDTIPVGHLDQGRDWTSRISTPFGDMYCHAIPRLLEVQMALASENGEYDQRFLAKIQSDPDEAQKMADYNKNREAWLAARH